MQELIKKLKSLDVLLKGDFTLKSGKKSSWYLDIRKAFGDSEALKMIVDYLYEKVDEKVTCVAAKGYGGIPIASAFAAIYDYNVTLVRESPKDHGTQALIEGYVPTSKDKIAIIDDIFTQGTSIRETAQALLPTKAKILGCYVVVGRGDSKDFEYPVEHLLTADDLLK